MQRALLLSIALTSLGFAGCLGEDPAKDLPDPGALLGSLLAGPALWEDPQNAPHPLWNWPTLSNPPNASQLPPLWEPIPHIDLPRAITAVQAVGKASDVTRGGGIAIFGRIAVVPGYGKDTFLLDLSDPANPKALSKFRPQEALGSDATHRGATTIAFPDGRLFTVISTARGLDVWNITDPTKPEEASVIKIPSHKVGVVPGTPIVYNAASGGGGAPNATTGSLGGRTAETGRGMTGIYNLTDPYKPVLVKNWTNGFSCHHVYFWNKASEGKYRGLCAGIQYTQIWDTANPLDPKIIVNVPVHHGIAGTPSGSSYGILPPGTLPGLLPVSPNTLAFSHYAGISNDGKTLLVGDEQGGGGAPPGCVASVNTPQGAASTPVGALWFYDISNEKDPKLRGWYSPLNDPRVKSAPQTSCTAHHGRMVPVPGRNVVAMSFYGAGVVVVDFTGVGTPGAPLPQARAQFAGGTNVWETWYAQGYLFTGDLDRGFDVLKMT